MINSCYKLIQVIDTINCKFRTRSQKAQGDLYEFFMKTSYEKEMKSDLIYGDMTSKSHFYFASQFMEIKEYYPNEIIYYEDDIATTIYLILLGSVRLKQFEAVQYQMNYEDYYMYLYAIKDDVFLLKNTIEANQAYFPVDNISDIDDIPHTITKIKLVKLATVSDIAGITDLLMESGLGENFLQFNDVAKNESSIDKFYDELIVSITSKETFYNKLSNQPQREVNILSYSDVTSFTKLEYFGNYKLGDTNYHRPETATAIQSTILLCINKKMYTTCILNDKRQLREKECDHLHQSYFFKGMRRTMFTKNFFYGLNIEEYPLDHILFKENDPLKYLFIIKEGTIELSLNNKSIIDIKLMIKSLKTLDPRFSKEEFNDSISLKNSPTVLMPFLIQKKNHVLFKTTKTILSEWECYYNTNYYYTAKVCSDHAKVYTLPIEALRDKENEDYALLYEHLKETAFTKVKGFLKRIITIKNASFGKIDYEFNDIKREGEKSYFNPEYNVMVTEGDVKLVNTPSKFNTILKTETSVNTHRKINSLFTLSSINRTKKNKKTIDQTQETPLPTIVKPLCMSQKDEIIRLEMKRKAKRKVENECTSSHLMTILPTINRTSRNIVNGLEAPFRSSSFGKYKTFKTYKHKHKKSAAFLSLSKKNDGIGIVNLKLSQKAELSKKKQLNYLVVQKFYDENKNKLLKSLKLK